ncbi:MAG TPA: ribulose-phosphate 3-epimerase [Candidatus Fimihabitans intestinipullorum]|uniref:Ribulose-phosphate 3-epimerase n=1 Tax=Candidatus Fimihabitans intestinipullorum TaxID=2840820 RepID=A0A9D1HUU2_9BACT|nr:ribulose-phosphate 3-epimerase [Candidatus Fimihabitans intestinipullorum]
MKVSASFLSIEDQLEDKIQTLAHANPDYLHLDIMDGNFVPRKTWSKDEMKTLLKDIDTPLDVHLMVEDIEMYAKEFSELHPEFITFHIEATRRPEEIIRFIHHLGCRVGITLNPNTSLENIIPYLGKVDLVLVMSVEAGAGGQEFLQNSIDRIHRLEDIRKQNGYEYLIEVDGGINEVTAFYCRNADILVAGSYITKSDDYGRAIEELKRVYEK